ncbi:MAG: tetratricopeptide repeat protein [Terracidiphilus sp.]
MSTLLLDLLTGLFILLVAVIPSHAQTKAEKKELAALYQKASDGDANAQLELGTRYLLGRGVAIEDAVQARNWFTKAADHGNATAQFWLGEMYSTGWGIPEDKARAAIWYRKAADQGQATAQYDLGIMYETGRGAPLNHNEAVAWIRKAANQDFAPAKAWLQTHSVASESAAADSADRNQPPQDRAVQTVSHPVAPPPIDIRYVPGDSRAVTDAEMYEIRNSLRWEPESVALMPGGTARSNLVDGKGQKMGSVLIRWDKTTTQATGKNPAHPDQWRGHFSMQIENGTSCRFTSSAELDDSQGFVVVTDAIWSSWMAQHQPDGGQTSQAHGDVAWTQNFPSLALKPLTAYSTLSACTTPKNP